jgi:hypothetical protein
VHLAVVVAVVAVDVVQMAVHQVVHVVAVRDRLMATARAVPVPFGVPAAIVGRGAARRVRAGDRQVVLLDAVRRHVVQVAVV